MLWAQRNNQPTRNLTDTFKTALDDQSYLAPQEYIYTWVWGDVQSWPPGPAKAYSSATRGTPP